MRTFFVVIFEIVLRACWAVIVDVVCPCCCSQYGITLVWKTWKCQRIVSESLVRENCLLLMSHVYRVTCGVSWFIAWFYQWLNYAHKNWLILSNLSFVWHWLDMPFPPNPLDYSGKHVPLFCCQLFDWKTVKHLSIVAHCSFVLIVVLYCSNYVLL